MIIIDTYTAKWDQAMNHPSPRIGSVARVAQSADAREWDGFRRSLSRDGKGLEWVRFMPRIGMDCYRVIGLAR